VRVSVWEDDEGVERRTLTQFRVCYPEGGEERGEGRPLMVLCPDAPRFQLPIFGHLGRVGWESAGAQSRGQRFTRARVGGSVRAYVCAQVYDVTVKDICRRVPYISLTNSTGIRLRFLFLFVQSYQQILLQTGKSLRRKVEEAFIHTRRRPFCHVC
jgi:hypothetical protein